MEILMYRPLVIALLEFSFAGLALWKGKYYKNIAFLFFIFLGGYQLGEFIMFATNGGNFGTSFAFASTTMLPPIGILFLQKISKKQLGFSIFQIIAVVFAMIFLLFPGIKENVGECYCFAKYAMADGNWRIFTNLWAIYYGFTLVYAMIAALTLFFKEVDPVIKKAMMYIFGIYCTFFPMTYFLKIIFNYDGLLVPSIMCSLAFFGACMALYMTVTFPDKQENIIKLGRFRL